MLQVPIKKQPDETTCGPTCLHTIYQFYGDSIELDTIINEILSLEDGGTLGALLAIHALKRGYKATIFSYNLQVFDPTWFEKVQISSLNGYKSRWNLKKIKSSE